MGYTHNMSQFEMPFEGTLARWDFRVREKRFFIYGQSDGQIAHCPNTGSMLGLLGASHVWVRDHGEESGRKLRYTAEILEVGGVMVGMNTQRANRLAAGAIEAGLVAGLSGEIRHEVKLDAATRFDLQVGGVWVEVKNVTLAEGKVGMFPDSKTERGAKHLRELARLAREGQKAAQVFVVQRGDCESVAPADAIDALYGAALREAVAVGVKVSAVGCRVESGRIVVDRALPVVM